MLRPTSLVLTVTLLAVFALQARAEPLRVTALYYDSTEEIEYQGVIFRRISEGSGADRSSSHGHKLASDTSAGANLRPFTRAWWGALCVSVLCVASAALMSGLTLGLVSVDPFELHVVLNSAVADCGSMQEQANLVAEKRYAARVLPLVSRHHLLLVTLLLANTAANETLPIFLDKVVPSWLAILLSVTFVVIFGEVLPSAVFTGPRRLQIAARFSGLVWFLIGLLCPVAWPISRLLDVCMGHHRPRYSRHQLKAILRMHGPCGGGSGNIAPSEAAQQIAVATRNSRSVSSRIDWLSLGGLTHEEMTIIDSVLESSQKTASDVMIPLPEVFMLDQEGVLDIDAMAAIMARGHSRVPVFFGRKANIRGILLIKKLMVVGPENRRPVLQLPLRKPVCAHKDTPLIELLHALRKGRGHVAVISTHPREFERCLEAATEIPSFVEVLGIVCLEDIFENIIGEPFIQEIETSSPQEASSRSSVSLRDAVSRVIANWRHKRRSAPSSAWQPVVNAASYAPIALGDPDEMFTPAALV